MARVAIVLQSSGELDRLIGARASNVHRVTGHVEEHRFKLVVQPPRFWRIPYLPVLVGTLHGNRVHVTARPQIYELVFLALWCALVWFEGGPAWFAFGVPAIYHLVGWGVFTSETDRVMRVLGAAWGGSGV